MRNDNLGVLARNGTQCTLTFTRELAHPPEKVWRAVTEPEHTGAWFPHAIVGDWSAGAALHFTSDMGDFEGQVIAVEPPSLLEFSWGEDRLRIELHPTPAGTRLVFTDWFDEVAKAARDTAGWHECLDRLSLVLDDGDLPRWGEGWRDFFARYQVALGPDASELGPPVEWEAAENSR